MNYPVNSVRDQKNALRDKYRAQRAAIDADERARRDAAIANAAANMASFRLAEYVLMYAPTGEEIDVTEIARRALELGKKVLYPVCSKEEHTMVYREIRSLDEVTPGAYDIPEPPANAPAYDPASDPGSAICFVPGLVYDKAGFRVGYGKGFYDRYLSAFAGCKIGVVYSDYILKQVPRGRFDVKVDILLCEKGVRTTSEK